MTYARAASDMAARGGIFPRAGAEQRMGTLLILFAALILLEGVLRKWVFPAIQQPLVFIREPALLLIYAFYIRDYGIRRWWGLPYVIFAGGVILLALAQAIYWQFPVLVPFLGVRFYILYIPLAFIMAEVLTYRQMGRMLRFLLWVSIPVGVLVFLQFSLPVAHPINKGTSDEIEGRFVVVADIVRPYGPFTFSAAQAHFAALMLALLAICIEARRDYRFPVWLLAGAGFAILTMGALSGGRTFFGFAILVVAAYLLAGLTTSRIMAGIKRLFLVGLLVTAFLVTFIVIFPQSYAAMMERQETAVSHEGSTLARVIRGFADVAEPLTEAPLFGYGLGSGTNAARLVRGADNGFILGETEWIRMVNELGPMIGYPVLVLRVLLVLWLGKIAFVANRHTADGSAMILFGFSGYLLLAGQVTLQNQLLAICWFSVGLLMAFARLARTPK